MLKFSRNKLVSIVKEDADTLIVHGVLDDYIYSLEIDVSIRISDRRILSIDGKWNRWTTPECPRAVPVLKEAVGFCIEEGIVLNIHKIIGRKGCRHFANLLIECCDTAREAAMLSRWEDAKVKNKGLSFEEFVSTGAQKLPVLQETVKHADVEKKVKGKPAQIKVSDKKDRTENKSASDGTSKGFVIDLHMHTSPASPCSTAPVDRLIEEAKNIGLDGICLTDHNYVWDERAVEDLRQKHGFLVLRGNEITTNQGDMLVFGMYNDIKGVVKLEDLRQEVVQAKGFIIVAHPFRGFLVFGVGRLGLTPEKAMERPLFKFVDAVEVLNGKVTKKENDFALTVANGLSLFTTGGSDAHEVSEVGRYATRFSDKIKNEKDLVNALKSGNYTPVSFR